MKKKIGILTQPLINNYGGILQAYALTTILAKMGYSVEIIDRKIDAYKDSVLKRNIKILIKKFILKRMNPDILKITDDISINTLRFIKENIPLSSKSYFSSNIMDINKNDYDVIIVGSDQVWRPIYSPCIGNYFLDFCKTNKKLKKISYAASFGVSDWEFTPEETKKCAELIKLFDAVSVREDSALTLCKDHLNVNAEHVLDPTLLLEKENYIDLVNKYNEPESEGNLMCYVLDNSKQKKEIISYVSQTLQLKLFSVMPQKSLNEKFNPSKHNEFEFPPLTKWLKGFIDAKFIITDSFHGCVFSIIFNKPFIAIGNKDRGLARFTSLLKLFALEDRLIFEQEDISGKYPFYSFDWNLINSIKENNKEYSLSFLKQKIGL